MKMKRKILLIKFERLRKKTLKMPCCMKEENGFDNTCKKTV